MKVSGGRWLEAIGLMKMGSVLFWRSDGMATKEIKETQSHAVTQLGLFFPVKLTVFILEVNSFQKIKDLKL
ncbi:hypothetical protein MSKU3_3262 [Komagataeibacter oboediens]|nr:hypothetical protein MSKU3_3262 [Komagataeibacter oboediens]